MGISLFYIIPLCLFLLGLLVISIIAGSFFGVFFILFFLFIGMTLFLRWILYFAETYFCTFYFIEGVRKIPYERVEKVSYESRLAGGGPSVISVYFIKNNKLKFAKFEVGTYAYIVDVLNFLKDKVQIGVIKEDGFREIGISNIDGIYKSNHPKNPFI